MTPNSTPVAILLAGKEGGEHLRAEVKEDVVVLVSHELRSVRPSVQWKDRTLVALSHENWKLVAKLLP